MIKYEVSDLDTKVAYGTFDLDKSRASHIRIFFSVCQNISILLAFSAYNNFP